jgi:hypothetical protein
MEAVIAGLAAACQEGNPLLPMHGKSVMELGRIPAEIPREARGRLRITTGIAGMKSSSMWIPTER